MPARPATAEQGIREDTVTVAQAGEVQSAAPAAPAGSATPAEAPPTEPPKGMDPAAPSTSLTMSNGIAAFCGLLIPGLGQLVQGRAVGALVIFGGSMLGWGIMVANLGDRITDKRIAAPAALVALGIQFVGIVTAAFWREPKQSSTGEQV